MHLPLLAVLALTAGGLDTDCCDRESGNHVELSFGYLGQWSDERNRALELKPSATDPAGAGAVTDPFLGAPYTGAVLAGPMLEWRAIYQHVRLTAGLRFPFASFRPSDTAQTVTIDGTARDVVVRSMSLWDVRTGLGVELPFARFTPFLDVLGDVETMTTQLSLDGQVATYTGRAFSLGGRLGLRYQVGHLFLALAAEAMGIGPLRLGGSLQVGLGY